MLHLGDDEGQQQAYGQPDCNETLSPYIGMATMSQKEFPRVKVVENAASGRLSVCKASGLLQLSERLNRRYRPDSICSPFLRHFRTALTSVDTCVYTLNCRGKS